MKFEESQVMRYQESLQCKFIPLSLKHNDVSVAIRSKYSVRCLLGYSNKTKQNKLAQSVYSIDTTSSGDRFFLYIGLSSRSWRPTGIAITVVKVHTQELGSTIAVQISAKI